MTMNHSGMGNFTSFLAVPNRRKGWPGANVTVLESHIFESLGWRARVVAGLIPNILHVGRKQTTLGALRVLTGWPNVMLLTHFGY